MVKSDVVKALNRIESYIESFPNTEIWVLANKKETGKIYWKQIARNINTANIKPFIATSRLGVLDGLNPKNTLILTCGKWWENPNANIFMNVYFNMARKVMPIDEIPSDL